MTLASRLALPSLAVALALGLALGLLGCAHRFDPGSTPGFQLLVGAEGSYYVHIPADATERARRGEKLPVILYLHGGDERGGDPARPTQVGLGPVVAEQQGRFPFVVLFPQCPKGRVWAMPDQLARLGRILDEALPRVGGDPDRVYLTGNSMGGYGTWLLAAEQPGRFAAIVPICGGVKPPKNVPIPKESRFGHLEDPYTAVAEAIGMMPTWAFHGAADWLVPPEETRRLVAALRARGNEARHTEYAGVGHQSWVPAYGDPKLLEWLAAQRRPAPATAPGAKPVAHPAAAGR